MPTSAAGVPDLGGFRLSPEQYRARHREALSEGDFNKRVLASWGLIARGADSIPLLLEMLAEPDPDAREDAAGALGWIGAHNPKVESALITAVETAEDHEERDAAIMALGSMRSKAAVPALATIIRDLSADGDTRNVAAIALGQIVKRRFDRQGDPTDAAMAWLSSR